MINSQVLSHGEFNAIDLLNSCVLVRILSFLSFSVSSNEDTAKIE